jgi:hypothetical protein
MAVFIPSAPYNACIIGKPKKSVFPSPAVKIKQPVSFDQLIFFLENEKKNTNEKQMLTTPPIGNNNRLSQ